MNRRTFLVSSAALAVTAALSLLGCGGSSASTADLTGTWRQSDKGDDTYMEAVIDATTITIYWVSDRGDTKSLYWAGSYTAPTSAVSEWSWTSANDKEQTQTALLASSDDTKAFTYKDGKISYSVSALGTTTTVYLGRV